MINKVADMRIMAQGKAIEVYKKASQEKLAIKVFFLNKMLDLSPT